MSKSRTASFLRPALLGSMLLLTAACAGTTPRTTEPEGLEPQLVTRAIQQASALRAAGRRVWCVPFARNASGIEIRGDARTWWAQAEDGFLRSHQPSVGAVMAFSGTRKLPLGHVAVVSKVISDRLIQVDHANWHRNEVSLGMGVMDVSPNNDWSSVRVESRPNSFGSVYRVDGFIISPGSRS